jgi:hypothetical protein
MSEYEKEKVGEWLHVDQLTPWDKNPRFNDQAIEKIAQSIKKFGFASPIIARKEDNRIIAGHTRWMAAQSLNIQYVPVRFMDLSEKEADALADFDMDVLGFGQQEIDQLMGTWEDPFFDDDDDDDNGSENDQIEDNGTTMIMLTVPVSLAKDTCDFIVDLLDDKSIEHTIKMK